MKNAFKFGFLAFAISLSVAACGSKTSEETTTDSTTMENGMVDSMAVDTTAAGDTAVVVDADSAAAAH